MKLRIVANGERRLHDGAQRKAQLRKLRDSIKAKHEAELAKAGLLRRLALRWGLATEFRRERRKIEPAPGSLYASRVDVAKPFSTDPRRLVLGFGKVEKSMARSIKMMFAQSGKTDEADCSGITLGAGRHWS